MERKVKTIISPINSRLKELMLGLICNLYLRRVVINMNQVAIKAKIHGIKPKMPEFTRASIKLLKAPLVKKSSTFGAKKALL